ncbi:MAG TPA: hypothetical protein VIM11_26570 [Tepidisphaeraceae bacterium]|jgi:hypothetical protein
MPRTARVAARGVIQHILNRGVGKLTLFRSAKPHLGVGRQIPYARQPSREGSRHVPREGERQRRAQGDVVEAASVVVGAGVFIQAVFGARRG